MHPTGISPSNTVRRTAHRRRGTGLAPVLIAGGVLAALMATRVRRRPAVPAQRVRAGAAILGGSVLADSAMEHLRGGLYNPAMYAAPALGAVSVISALRQGSASHASRGPVASIVGGLAGLGFHSYDILRRVGGVSFNNLFYAAPIGAPGALVISGALNLFADQIENAPSNSRPTARVLAGVTGASLLAETAEVGLLHFRGSFQNPAMFLPVTIPPIAGALLLAKAARPDMSSRPVREFLKATALLGFVGTGFHIYGVSRHMGGWRNWRQTAFDGPPVPAPISFTGLALAGSAAVDLIEKEETR
ncbi:MAG: hypothetical protein Q4P24_03110 [Rhodobacterales bacterium]|nr:hypothetical protein [Rhodobacterales bacterium]